MVVKTLLLAPTGAKAGHTVHARKENHHTAPSTVPDAEQALASVGCSQQPSTFYSQTESVV